MGTAYKICKIVDRTCRVFFNNVESIMISTIFQYNNNKYYLIIVNVKVIMINVLFFQNYLSVLWGKLASEILVQNWDGALDDLTKLREFIDNGGAGATASNMQALQQRTWLVHWSLFVFFNHVKGRDLIIEMFLYKPLYLNAIQTMCPHILRYLATAVIINRSRRNALKDLVKVIQQEAYTYR